MKDQRGQTLVEAILSLAVISAVITAVVIAVLTALSGTGYNEKENQALGYAQEGLDIVRDIKSTDFTSFTASYPTNYYCLAEGETVPQPYSDCNGSNVVNVAQTFLRVLYVNHSGNGLPPASPVPKCSNGTYTASIVSWSDGKCTGGQKCHKVQLESCFTNLNAIPTP